MKTTLLSSKLFPLKGEIQNYAWGGESYISKLLKKEIQQVKCAEYWLGAHSSAPSYYNRRR